MTRRGQLTLVLVVVMVALAAIVAFGRQMFTRQVHSESVRVLVHRSATQSAQGVIASALAELIRAATDPRHPKFAELRRRLITATAPPVDLTDLAGTPAVVPALEWMRRDGHTVESVGRVQLDRLRVTVERLRPLYEKVEGGHSTDPPSRSCAATRRSRWCTDSVGRD